MSNSINPLSVVIPTAKTIAEYLKLIESLESKIDKSNNSNLDAAVDQLKFIQKLEDQDQKIHLPIVIDRFFLAKKLEDHNLKNIKRLYAVYSGLALCQKLMSYDDSAIDTLIKYINLDLKVSSQKRMISTLITFFTISPLLVASSFLWMPPYQINRFFKINNIDKFYQKFFKTIEQYIPYHMDKEKLYLLKSQKDSYSWAKEIKDETF